MNHKYGEIFAGFLTYLVEITSSLQCIDFFTPQNLKGNILPWKRHFALFVDGFWFDLLKKIEIRLILWMLFQFFFVAQSTEY